MSHGFLILRAPLYTPDKSDPYYDPELSFNVDIEFTDVSYIDIPSLFKGISISSIKENIPIKFMPYLNVPTRKLYQLESEDKVFYIVASYCLIGTSTWINEDRIHFMDLKYDKVLMEF